MTALFALAVPLCTALTVPQVGRAPQLGRATSAAPVFFDPLNLNQAGGSTARPTYNSPAAFAVGAAAFAAAQPEAALAKGGEYGIFEGRIVSLAHPAVMATMYAATAFAAFTGFQWRRQRELGTQIAALKAEQAGPKAKLAALEEGETNPSLTAQVASLQTQIDELSATRKALASDNLREKHYQVLLACTGSRERGESAIQNRPERMTDARSVIKQNPPLLY